MFYILIASWLVSPVVLMILFIIQLQKNSELNRKNLELNKTIQRLMSNKSISVKEERAPEKSNVAKPAIQSGKAVVPAQQPIQRPTQQPIQQPARQVQPNPSPQKKVSAINIILILGTLLLSLSGFIFAVATWGRLNMFLKSAVLLSFSVLFFGIHLLTERKLKLLQTGRIFYILGSIFLPSAVIAAGILKVFGTYYSFFGEGRASVFALVFISICIPFFKGARNYNSRLFAAISCYSFSAVLISVIWQISPNGNLIALLMAVFSLMIVLFEPAVQKLFKKCFGEKNVFATEWNRFSIINAWVLSLASLFLSDGGFISLAAFAVFSICFLTKTVTDKSGSAGAIGFAFFVTAAMFTGFDPREISGFVCVIAATSLIYAVLSVMGIFPSSLKKTMRILGMVAAGIAGMSAVIDNIGLILKSEAPSIQLIIAAVAIYGQFVIFALRYKTTEYKILSFGALLWLTTDLFFLIFGGANNNILAQVLCFGVILSYFSVVRFTSLRDRLYHPVLDVIVSAFAFILVIVCCLFYGKTAGAVWSFAILAAGIAVVAKSKQKIISPVACVLLTYLAIVPTVVLLKENEVYFMTGYEIYDALAVVVMAVSVTAAVLLFAKKQVEYAWAYGIGAVVSIPVYTLASLLQYQKNFAPMLVLTVYIALYLYKIAFPKEKYAHVNFLNGMIMLTSMFAGMRFVDISMNFTERAYWWCVPATAVLVMFVVMVIGRARGKFEKTAHYTELFLWFAVPYFSGGTLFHGFDKSNPALMVFGVILGLCTVYLSICRKNTLTLIYPIVMGLYVIGYMYSPVLALMFAVAFAVAGRFLFRRKMFDAFFLDVFSIAAFPAVLIMCIHGANEMWRWFSLLMCAALTVNLIRREQFSTAKKTILTVALAFIFPLWWTQPFFTIPDLIIVQFNLLPLVIFCVVLRFIWRDAEAAVYNVSFGAAILSLVILFGAAIISDEVFDAVFIGVVIMAMLAVSFVIKRKRWFVLAVAAMVTSAVLLSFRLRDSKAWLVYLAVAGALLIALGVANELIKQRKKEGGNTKLTRFMSDWTW